MIFLSRLYENVVANIKSINWKDPFRWIISFLASIAVHLFGGWDRDMWVMLGFILADLATGMGAAYKEGKLDSKKAKKGALGKIGYFAVVFVAYWADVIMNGGGAIRALAVIYLIATEGLSILENAARWGAPVPKKLVAALEQLKGDDEKSQSDSADEKK